MVNVVAITLPTISKNHRRHACWKAHRIQGSSPERLQNIFFFGRCFMSLGILVFAFTVTLVALFERKTAVLLFFLLMSVVR